MIKELEMPLMAKKQSLKAQRIELAKDALKQLKMNRIIVDSGGYVKIDQGILQVKKELQSQLPGLVCKVCLKGGLFIAHVDKYNHCKVGKFGLDLGDDEMKNRLSPIFGKLQLDMMEAAFEKRVVADSKNKLEIIKDRYRVTALGQTCIDFGKKFRSDKIRFIAILENVIENGKFVP